MACPSSHGGVGWIAGAFKVHGRGVHCPGCDSLIEGGHEWLDRQRLGVTVSEATYRALLAKQRGGQA